MPLALRLWAQRNVGGFLYATSPAVLPLLAGPEVVPVLARVRVGGGRAHAGAQAEPAVDAGVGGAAAGAGRGGGRRRQEGGAGESLQVHKGGGNSQQGPTNKL